MGSLLPRLGKKGGDPTDPAVRAAYGRLSGLVGIFCNLLLCAGKVLVGSAAGSVAIVADGLNNLSDASSCIVTMVGFKMAGKPADADHPFGHARMEYLAGLAVSAMILLIGAELGKSSLDKILHPEPVQFSALLVAVLVLSMAVKLGMALLNRSLSRKIHSTALEATAADSRNDVIATGAVLLASVLGEVTGVRIDGWAGMAVAVFIVWSGVGLAKSTINPLLGEQADPALRQAIIREVKSSDKVLGFHDLMVHDYGPGQRFASIHVEMDSREDVMLCHDIIDEIERACMEKLHVHLVIHYDPIVTGDPEQNHLMQVVEQTLKALDPALSLHDFRMVRGQGHSNLIFDMVLPDAWEGRKQEIQDALSKRLSQEPHKYYTVITYDAAGFNENQEREA